MEYPVSIGGCGMVLRSSFCSHSQTLMFFCCRPSDASLSPDDEGRDQVSSTVCFSLFIVVPDSSIVASSVRSKAALYTELAGSGFSSSGTHFLLIELHIAFILFHQIVHSDGPLGVLGIF